MSALNMQALQLVDSTVEATRRHWRREFWGFSDEVANDPRPMREILGKWPDWRTGKMIDAPPEQK